MRRQPHKLLLVTTGNIGNRELERLFEDNLELIAQAFETSDFIELDRTSLIIHQCREVLRTTLPGRLPARTVRPQSCEALGGRSIVT